MPAPLPEGTILNDRFELESVLGNGGFSIVYLARDHQRKDHVVVKELAPRDSRRNPAGTIDLGSDSHRLRRKFLDEGAIQSKLRIDGLVPIRSWFGENGTAYLVSDYLPGTRTLDDLIREHVRLAADQALVIFSALIEILHGIHGKGILHRDIKPSNVLVGTNDQVWLIDFGAAREWQLDAHTETVLFTPGFAPPEQLSDKARRGPPTDIYSLCATLYQMLTGVPPPGAAERAAGDDLDLTALRQSAGARVANAVESGLALRMVDRPQTVDALQAMLGAEGEQPVCRSLSELDELLFRAQRFTFGKRQCPGCGGVLIEPRPLGKNVCPVCREGRLEHRQIHEKLCPNCRVGVLHRHANADPPYICPDCRVGVIRHPRLPLLGRHRAPECSVCKNPTDLQTYRPIGPRSTVVWCCDECEAQFDEQPDTRLMQVIPKPDKYASLYLDEWARVAAGFEPGAGNVECSACGAEYHRDDSSLTLLGAHHDPHDFVRDFAGRRLDPETIRWLGVGKSSPHRGFVCEDCGTEMDFAGTELLLVYSPKQKLAVHAEECATLEAWHRLGQGLPGPAQFEGVTQDLLVALREAYIAGQIGFDCHCNLAWKGPGHRTDNGQDGVLSIDASTIAFGGMVRRWRAQLSDSIGFEFHEDPPTGTQLFVADIRGEPDPIAFALDPIELTAELKSGVYTITLEPADLVKRISRSA